MKKPGGVYCSEECFEKMGSFQDRVDTLDKSRKGGLSMGKFVKPIVIVAVVGAILYFVFVVQEVRSVGDLVDMVKGFLP